MRYTLAGAVLLFTFMASCNSRVSDQKGENAHTVSSPASPPGEADRKSGEAGRAPMMQKRKSENKDQRPCNIRELTKS
jgi:hypothetical protein